MMDPTCRNTPGIKPFLALVMAGIIAILPMKFSVRSTTVPDKLSEPGSLAVQSRVEDVFHDSPPPVSDMAGWLNEWRLSPSDSLLAEGLEIARTRRATMLEVIPNHPGRAIDAMLRFQDYLDLPVEISELIEQPFAVFGDVAAVSVCGSEEGESHHGDGLLYVGEWDGESRELFLPEERTGLLSKVGFPMTGVELDNQAALHRDAAHFLSHEELAAAGELFNLSGEANEWTYNFLLGNHLLNSPEDKQAEILNEILTHAEQQIGPETVVAAMAALQSGNSQPAEVYEAVQQASEEWTLTPKKVLLVRLVFPDLDKTVRSAGEIQDWLQIASDQFQTMSAGQTHFSDMTVTAAIYTLPKSSAYYATLSNGGRLAVMHMHADNLVAGGGIVADEYDVVILVTPPIPGVGLRGYATIGSGRQWFFDSESGLEYATMRHEFGHNYGLYHASSWEPNDGSIMSTESSNKFHVEYGDKFDFMGRCLSEKGEFNVFEKSRLGWIDESRIVSLNTELNETIRIHRFDHPESQKNSSLALRIEYGPCDPIWVMYRRNFESNKFLNNGAYLLWEYETNQARLLDMTPRTNFLPGDVTDAALTLGNTFTDSREYIRITPLAVGGDEGNEWMDIQVEIGHRNPPGLRLTVPIGSVAGSATELTATGLESGHGGILYRWDFGDGSIAETSDDSVEHVYEQPGAYSVHVIARSQLHGVVSESFVLEVAGQPASRYEAWLSRDFSLAIEDDALLPDNDYDGDGFANILEYGLGLDPTVSDAAQFLNVQLLRVARGEDIEIECRNVDAGLNVRVYVSKDLKSWTTARLSNSKPKQGFDAGDPIISVQMSDTEDGFHSVQIKLNAKSVPLFMKFGVSYQQVDIQA